MLHFHSDATTAAVACSSDASFSFHLLFFNNSMQQIFGLHGATHEKNVLIVGTL